MPRKYSFLQVFWPAIVAGGTLTILLGIWTFNTFLPSEGESIPPDSLKIIWLWLIGGLLITAATIYFCHTRLRALSKSLEDLTGLIPELHASPISSHSIPPWFPEGDRLFKNLTSFGTNAQKELDLQRQKILEKETILSILMEGYVALDLKQNILDLNSAAAEMLQIDESTARHEFFGSLIRHVVLLDLVKKVLGCGKEIQDDIEIRTDERSLYLQVLCRPLIESGISEGIGLPPNSGSSPSTMEKQIGVLILLNDITQLQRLETVRRDFIANVSHELKTPITSIKGSVETLLQEEEMDGSTLNRFLKIIARHSDRLNSIIED
ncbi:MAG: histidine kinase dimerization/phospho-acceptor domain-containing protein, partial [SAR324 cluster bacterium]|nr:histidine kinase dimerization/phospho-acceptor domain-containing protein [SAR324 cluster bacterium]